MIATSAASTTTLSQLQQLFPATLMLDTHTLAGVLGIAYKTLNNQSDRFPIKPVKFGRRKLYRIIDVAGYIDAELGISPPPLPTPSADPLAPAPAAAKRRPGRPRKFAAGAA